MFNKQEIFETMVKNLMKQGRKSVVGSIDSGDETCLYRGPNGSKCAIGFLIDDLEYNESFENETPNETFYTPDNIFYNSLNNITNFLITKYKIDNNKDIKFFKDAQSYLHDDLDGERFKDRLVSSARNFALIYDLSTEFMMDL